MPNRKPMVSVAAPAPAFFSLSSSMRNPSIIISCVAEKKETQNAHKAVMG